MQCGRGWRRCAGLGRDAAAHVHPVGRDAVASRWSSTTANEGSDAGISSADAHHQGPLRLWLLRARTGVHRLVRISPFDEQARRRPAFAASSLTPMIEDATSQVGHRRKDLQSIPTAAPVQAASTSTRPTPRCASPICRPAWSCRARTSAARSRTGSRACRCWRTRSSSSSARQREAKLASITGPTKDAAWGNQIRSYVLAPYQMVKDLRTGDETAKVDAVLDGDLDPFMEAWLRWRRAGMPELS